MNNFYHTILLPAFEAFQVKSIVEIGCHIGENTAQLLSYAMSHGAVLHSIDPEPSFDAESWKSQYGGFFQFYRSLSLDTLPRIGFFDCVLIDGDHNWYTVYHELKLIERLSLERGHDMPLIVCHDIGWPYARRDLYYSPDSIPAEYRHPYKQGALHPNSNALLPSGFNERHTNALYEGGPRNGVLTAIEDFLRETQHYQIFIKLPGYHGLGVLVPASLEARDKDLYDMMKTMVLPAPLEAYFNQLEASRVLGFVPPLPG